MIKSGQLNLGDWLANHRAKFRNRTGATLLRGQVAMLDVADSEGAGFDIEDDSVFSNLVTVTQAGFDLGYPILVCDDVSIVNDAFGDFNVCGPRVPVAVADDDVSTNDVDAGDPLTMLVSELATGVAQYIDTVGSGSSRHVGFSWEDAAADSDDTDRVIDASSHLRFCLWTGGIPVFGIVTPDTNT
jgi:hypothetical protein